MEPYRVNRYDLVDVSPPPPSCMDVVRQARERQLYQVNERLRMLLPEHLRDEHDLPAARAWFQEHGITLETEAGTYKSTLRYPNYLE